MAIIVNKLKQALPTPPALTFEEQLERDELRYRSDLGRGPDRSGLKPLNVAEMKAHRKFQAGKWLARAPRWNGRDFPFAAAGTQGSAYELPGDVALFLKHKYNAGAILACEREGDEILHILGPTETLPPGVTPIRLNVDDPMRYSSEALLSRGQVVSQGLAEPPPPVDPKEVAIPMGDVPPAYAPKGRGASAGA